MFYISLLSLLIWSLFLSKFQTIFIFIQAIKRINPKTNFEDRKLKKKGRKQKKRKRGG